MRRARLALGAPFVVVAVVWVGNCVKNVVVARRVAKVCPALYASTSERLANSGPLFDRLFEADAPLMRQMPEAVVGRTCARLEAELVWYRWNLGRTVRMDETRALRQELVAVLDRTLPVCVERATRGVEPDEQLRLGVAAASCQMLKTLRGTLNTPVLDASPWGLADQLERLAPYRPQVAEGRGP